jgi:hypothetical protein
VLTSATHRCFEALSVEKPVGLGLRIAPTDSRQRNGYISGHCCPN